MIRFLQIVMLSFFALQLAGCNEGEKSVPLWEQVKVRDIAPSQSSKQPGSQVLKTINFDVHIFEVPAEDISKLNNIWRMLNNGPLRCRSYKAFRANSFFVRFGKVQIWDKIVEQIRRAGGHKVMTISLLLPDNQAEAVTVAGLNSREKVYYVSTKGTTQAATIGPGILTLQIRAAKVRGSSGACNVICQPVFSVPISSPVPELAARAKRHEFRFASAAFGLKMSPGEFIFLGPDRYISDQRTLGGLFFSKPQGSVFFSENERKPPELKPAVKLFVLVCTSIND